jgi:hypothetical protein
MAGAIISRLDGAHGIAGWRWLFLVEGVMTVFSGFVRKCRSAFDRCAKSLTSSPKSTLSFRTGL